MIKARRIGHAVFETPDLERLSDHYTDVVGLVLASQEKGQRYFASKLGHLTIELRQGSEAGCVLEPVDAQQSRGNGRGVHYVHHSCPRSDNKGRTRPLGAMHGAGGVGFFAKREVATAFASPPRLHSRPPRVERQGRTRSATRASQEVEQRRSIEVEHSRVDDLSVCKAVDADGGQIDCLSGLRVLCPLPPDRDHVVALGDEPGIETADVPGLEAVPSCPEAQSVAKRTLVSAVLSAIRQARSLVDHNVLVVGRHDTFAIPMFDRTEQAASCLEISFDRILRSPIWFFHRLHFDSPCVCGDPPSAYCAIDRRLRARGVRRGTRAEYAESISPST
jgi:catechol 2,3-dioxygenase-like lactoylglutathione lyase family enzyme